MTHTETMGMSRDGALAAVSGRRLSAWDAAGRWLLSINLPLAQAADHLAFSEDGSTIAITAWLNDGVVIDVKSGAIGRFTGELRDVQPAPGNPTSPWIGLQGHDVVRLDASFRVTGSLERSKEFGDIQALDRRLAKLPYMDGRRATPRGVSALVVSADGRTAAAVLTMPKVARIQLWSLESNRLIESLPIDTFGGARGLAISPSGDRVALAAQGAKPVLVIDRNPSAPRRLPLAGGDVSIRGLAFSPDGKRLLATGLSKLTVWEASSGALLWSEQGTTYRKPNAFAHGPKSLAVGMSNAGIVRLDPITGRALGRYHVPIQSPLRADLIDSDHVLLYNADSEVSDAPSGGRFVLWSRREPERQWRADHLGNVKQAEVRADGTLVVAHTGALQCPGGGLSVAVDELVRAPSGSMELSVAKRQAHCIRGVPMVMDVSLHDPLALALSHKDLVTETVDGGSRTVLQRSRSVLHGHQALSADGRYAVALANQKPGEPERILVWEARTGRLLHELKAENAGHDGFLRLTLAPDGTRVAASREGFVDVFELPGAKRLRAVPTSFPVTALRFTSNSTRLELHSTTHFSLLNRDGGPLGPGTAADLVVRIDPSRTVVELLGARDGALRASLITFSSSDHVVFTPGGWFATTGDAATHVSWRFPESDEDWPLSAFVGQNSPASVRAVLDGAGADAPPPAPPPSVSAAEWVSPDTLRVSYIGASQVERVSVVQGLSGVDGAIASQAACQASGSIDIFVPTQEQSLFVVAVDHRGIRSSRYAVPGKPRATRIP